MKGIKNIIFDLGGVLLNIDFEQSQKAFHQYGIFNFRDMVSPIHSNDLFHALETGLDIPLFFEKFRIHTGADMSNKQIEAAWCALLIDFRTKSIEAVQELKTRYKTFLLSNTNEIHLQHIYQLFRNQFSGQELDDCFDTSYYSHRIELRKPDAKAWLYVLDKHRLTASETLFIDDSTANVEAARALGMHTIHLLPSMCIEDLNL